MATISNALIQKRAEKLVAELATEMDRKISGEGNVYKAVSSQYIENESACLVIFSGVNVDIESAAVIYNDGTAFFLDDWQGSYPKTVEEIGGYDWMSTDGGATFVFDGMPRVISNAGYQPLTDEIDDMEMEEVENFDPNTYKR